MKVVFCKDHNASESEISTRWVVSTSDDGIHTYTLLPKNVQQLSKLLTAVTYTTTYCSLGKEGECVVLIIESLLNYLILYPTAVLYQRVSNDYLKQCCRIEDGQHARFINNDNEKRGIVAFFYNLNSSIAYQIANLIGILNITKNHTIVVDEPKHQRPKSQSGSDSISDDSSDYEPTEESEWDTEKDEEHEEYLTWQEVKKHSLRSYDVIFNEVDGIQRTTWTKNKILDDFLTTTCCRQRKSSVINPCRTKHPHCFLLPGGDNRYIAYGSPNDNGVYGKNIGCVSIDLLHVEISVPRRESRFSSGWSLTSVEGEYYIYQLNEMDDEIVLRKQCAGIAYSLVCIPYSRFEETDIARMALQRNCWLGSYNGKGYFLKTNPDGQVSLNEICDTCVAPTSITGRSIHCRMPMTCNRDRIGIIIDLRCKYGGTNAKPILCFMTGENGNVRVEVLHNNTTFVYKELRQMQSYNDFVMDSIQSTNSDITSFNRSAESSQIRDMIDCGIQYWTDRADNAGQQSEERRLHARSSSRVIAIPETNSNNCYIVDFNANIFYKAENVFTSSNNCIEIYDCINMFSPYYCLFTDYVRTDKGVYYYTVYNLLRKTLDMFISRA